MSVCRRQTDEPVAHIIHAQTKKTNFKDIRAAIFSPRTFAICLFETTGTLDSMHYSQNLHEISQKKHNIIGECIRRGLDTVNSQKENKNKHTNPLAGVAATCLAKDRTGSNQDSKEVSQNRLATATSTARS